MRTFASKLKATQRAKSDQLSPGPAPSAQGCGVRSVVGLQRTIGNRAVQGVLQAKLQIQAQLEVSEPGDFYEQEADRVADQVMSMPEPVVASAPEHRITAIQRQSLAEDEEEPLQARPAQGSRPLATWEMIARTEASKSGGEPLPKSARDFFEPRFGCDFSEVRVHTGAHAQETAQRLRARAFTVGRDVVFNVGEYAPGTREGKKLLAHELTHVIQQNAAKHRKRLNRVSTGPASLPMSVTGAGGVRVQRQPIVNAAPASATLSGIDHSRNSQQLGAMAGGGNVAYGLTHHSITMPTTPDTMPRASGGNWRVALWSVQFFSNVDDTIYITSNFPANSCYFQKTLDHEIGHFFDAYAIMVRHRGLLINDLRAVRPGPNNPFVTNNVAAAQLERQRIRSRVATLVDCAKNQACYDMYRFGYARDVREYPTIPHEIQHCCSSPSGHCPPPRPAVPVVPPRGHVAVNCRQPPQSCPRPVIRFP